MIPLIVACGLLLVLTGQVQGATGTEAKSLSGPGPITAIYGDTFVGWVASQGFGPNQKARHQKLSMACGKGEFRPRMTGRYLAYFKDRILDAAYGTGANLIDRKGLGRPGKMYLFRHAGTTNCWVVETTAPVPAG